MSNKCGKCGKILYYKSKTKLYCRGCDGDEDDSMNRQDNTIITMPMIDFSAPSADVSYDTGSGGDSFQEGGGDFGGAGASGDW